MTTQINWFIRAAGVLAGLGMFGLIDSAHAGWTAVGDFKSCPSRYVPNTSGREGPFPSQSACLARIEAVKRESPMACARYKCVQDDAPGATPIGGDLTTDATRNVVQGLMTGNSQQMGVGLMGIGAAALIQGMQSDPAAEARRAEAAAQAAAQAAAEQRRRSEELERRAEEIRGQLLGVTGGSGSLSLMGVDSGPGLSLMTDSAKSSIFSKGFEHASQCISQNAGSACAGVTAEQQQACVADYRAGYDSGSQQKELVLQEAFKAGQRAAARGELANGASDQRAQGPCRTDWIMAYNSGHFGAKSPPPPGIKPAVAAVDTKDPEVTRIINEMNALAKRLGWSAEEQARLAAALNNLGADGDPNVTGIQIRQTWGGVLARGQDADLARKASGGEGPGFPGAGTQSFNDCTIFALANAANLPYSVVAARATELIRQGEWRDAAARANPQKAIEQRGLMGGEVVMIAESLGQAEVVRSTDFAKTLKEGRPVMVNVVPENGDVRNGHQVVLSKTFQHGGETWYEMMNSNQGPQQRLYLSAKELNTMLQETGVAFRPEPGRTPRVLR